MLLPTQLSATNSSAPVMFVPPRALLVVPHLHSSDVSAGNSSLLLVACLSLQTLLPETIRLSFEGSVWGMVFPVLCHRVS